MVYGMLNTDPLSPTATAGSAGAGSGTASSLGWELDLNFNYKPYERFTWITEAGVLLPGEAWQGGNQGLENKLGYGLMTKAAVNF